MQLLDVDLRQKGLMKMREQFLSGRKTKVNKLFLSVKKIEIKHRTLS
jgi:hypothetical protein